MEKCPLSSAIREADGMMRGRKGRFRTGVQGGIIYGSIVFKTFEYGNCRWLGDSWDIAFTASAEEGTESVPLCPLGAGGRPAGLPVFAGKRGQPDTQRRDGSPGNPDGQGTGHRERHNGCGQCRESYHSEFRILETASIPCKSWYSSLPAFG